MDAATTREEKALELTAAPRHSVIGLGSTMSTTQICATIQARKEREEQKRAPVDILVALDNSLSMQEGDKLALCKKSLKLLLRILQTEDRFGLVTFSDEAVVEVPVGKLTPQHKRKALEAIESLKTKSCTNISSAIGLAASALQRVAKPHAVRAIFLLTDGLANRGVSDTTSLVQFTKSHCLVEEQEVDEASSMISESSWHNIGAQVMKVEALDDIVQETTQQPTITLHCFGYGPDHDSRMLQSISEATPGGTYYFVEKDSHVLNAIGDALGGVLSVVAQSAVLHITVPHDSKALGVEIIKVHHINKVLKPDGSYLVSLGDFYAEESRDVIVEVKLATPPASGTAVDHLIAHATLSLSFTDALRLKPSSCRPISCGVSRLPGTGVSAANPHVKVQWLRIRVTEVIAEADQLSQLGSLGEARAVIAGMLEAIQLSADGGEERANPLVGQLIGDLTRIQEGLVSKETYAEYGGHRIQNTMQMHRQQRCTDSSLEFFNVYRSSAKTGTLSMFSQK